MRSICSEASPRHIDRALSSRRFFTLVTVLLFVACSLQRVLARTPPLRRLLTGAAIATP